LGGVKHRGFHGGKENNSERGRCKGEVTFSALFHLTGQKHTSVGPFVKSKARLEMTRQVKKIT